MISFEQALDIISSQTTPFKQETISIEDAKGRILAENICADRNYPPFNRAAMDGYAIRFSDWQQGMRKYQITEVIYAGQASQKSLAAGSCYKIMTGAATPAPADMIIRREDAEEEGNEVILNGTNAKPFQNIAIEGEDAATASTLLTAPCRCTSQVISLLASVGKTRIKVYKLPKVALLTTGNEITNPSEPAGPFQIRNSNQHLLKSLLKQWNITPGLCEHIPDDPKLLKHTFEKLGEMDITIISGGVSAGDADYVPAALKEAGAKELFHKVSIRPGKPIWTGKTKTGGIVFALPGNPFSCLCTFTVFIESFLYQSFEYRERPLYRLPLLQSRIKKHALTEFLPVNINKQNGGLTFSPFNGSGDITAGLHSNGLILHPAENPQLRSGELTLFYPFNNYL